MSPVLTGRRWRLVVVGLLVTVGALLVVSSRSTPAAMAHAVLVRSVPAAEAQLGASPPAIDLWFSEPLEADFSTFEVLDASGRPRTVDGIAVDAADAHHLAGLPRRLPGGVYTVAYRTLSQHDGHEWTGTFSFTVLNPDGSVPSASAFAADVERGSTPAHVTGRWLMFLGFAVLVGGALLVLLDAAGRRGTPDAAARDAALLYRRLALATLPLLVGGALLGLANQVIALDGRFVEVLTGTRFGVWWLWRASVIAGVATALAAASLRADASGDHQQRWLALVLPLLGGAGMATITANSHAAAAPGVAWALLFDLVHFVTAGVWVGGLVALAALLWRGRGREPRHAEALLRRWVVPFSTVAAISVFTLALTGTLRAFGELPTATALVDTGYGRWLLAKLALITPVLGVAWLNRRTLRRTGASALSSVSRLRRLVALEAGIAILVLLSVAILGQVPTARGVVRPPGAAIAGTLQDFNGIASAGDLTVHLQVSPATLGSNVLRAHVYRPDGGDAGLIERVRLTLATNAGAGGQQLEAAPQGSGVFLATDGLFSLAQPWNVRVEVQRAGRDDLAVPFDVPIAEAAAGSSGSGALGLPAPQLTMNALAAFVAVAFGVGVLAWQGRRRGASMRALGALLLGAGVVFWISGETHSAAVAGFPVNPVAPDTASQARGAALYGQLCAECHGVSGEGNGPLAATLNPPPASLAVHMPLHPDGQAYIFISKGFPGTAMPAWESRLSEEQRWDLVNYLRALTTAQTR